MEVRVGRVGNTIRRKIGSNVYGVANVQTGDQMAMKFEPLTASHPRLAYESQLYRIMNDGGNAVVVGIPSLRWYGVKGDCNVMVTDLLGPDLEVLFNFCGRKFGLKTVLMVADQMIARVEYFHSKDYLHRDLRPKSFCMGMEATKAHHVYIIDYGSAKQYRDSTTHEHIPYMEHQPLTRAPRYASINTHLGTEPSRRDDMEALGYIFMYFLRGSLPWQGLKVQKKEELSDRGD